MAHAAGALRSVAHSLHAAQPLVQAGRAGARLGAAHARAGAGRAAGRGLLGPHDHQAASGRGGSAENKGPQAIDRSHGGWTTKLHLLARDDRGALTLGLSPGQSPDAPAGQALLQRHGPRTDGPALLTDRAYANDATRALAAALGVLLPTSRICTSVVNTSSSL